MVHTLPIGFVADPTELTFDQCIESMAAVMGQTATIELAWFNQPFLWVWHQSIFAHLDEFAVPLVTHKDHSRPLLPATFADHKLPHSLMLHLAWSLIHHLFLDHWAATIETTMKSRLDTYFKALIENATAPSLQAEDPTVG